MYWYALRTIALYAHGRSLITGYGVVVLPFKLSPTIVDAWQQHQVYRTSLRSFFLGDYVSASTTAPCDLILSPHENPPDGFCGPRILIVGAMKVRLQLTVRLKELGRVVDNGAVTTKLNMHPMQFKMHSAGLIKCVPCWCGTPGCCLQS